MKPSNILFASILALLLLLACAPQMLGFIKINKQNKPTDFLSRFWRNHSEESLGEHKLPTFSYIQLDGNGSNFHLSITKGASDSVLAHTPSSRDLKVTVKSDTLFLKPLVISGAYINLQVPQQIKGVKIREAEVSASVEQRLLANMNWQVSGQTDLYLQRPEHWQADTTEVIIPLLHIEAKEASKVVLDKYRFEQVQAVIDNSLLQYSVGVKADTMQVKLAGKSSVSSVIPTQGGHGVKVLNISGDKKFFNKRFLGSGVQVNLLD